MDATSRSHVFPRPVRVGRRLLSSLQHLRPISSCVRRLLVRKSMLHRGPVLPQVPYLQVGSSFSTFRLHPLVAEYGHIFFQLYAHGKILTSGRLKLCPKISATPPYAYSLEATNTAYMTALIQLLYLSRNAQKVEKYRLLPTPRPAGFCFQYFLSLTHSAACCTSLPV